jgi:anaerobic selenocysteine-containing dehydrogenase
MVLTPPPQWMQPGGRTGHQLPGIRIVETIASGEPYPVKSLWMVAFGFATQTPLFKRFIEQALPALDLFVVSEQMMTPAARGRLGPGRKRRALEYAAAPAGSAAGGSEPR